MLWQRILQRASLICAVRVLLRRESGEVLSNKTISRQMESPSNCSVGQSHGAIG